MQEKQRLFLPELVVILAPQLETVVRDCLRKKPPGRKLKTTVARGVVTKNEEDSSAATKTYLILIPEIDRLYAVRPYETTEERLWRQRKQGRTYSTRVLTRLSLLLADVDELEEKEQQHLVAHHKTLEDICQTRHRIRRAAGRIMRRARHIDNAIQTAPLIWRATSSGLFVDTDLAASAGVSADKLNARAAKIAHSVDKHNRLVDRHTRLTARIWTPQAEFRRARTEQLWHEIQQDVLSYDVMGDVSLSGLVLRVLEAEVMNPTHYERMYDTTEDENGENSLSSEHSTDVEDTPQPQTLPSLDSLAAAGSLQSVDRSAAINGESTDITRVLSPVLTSKHNTPAPAQASTPSPKPKRQRQRTPTFLQSPKPTPKRQKVASSPAKRLRSNSPHQIQVSSEAARLAESILESKRKRHTRFQSPASESPADLSDDTLSLSESAKKYHCKDCNVVFRHSKYFKRHLLKHTKPFACDVEGCDKQYTRNDTLKRHLANVHKRKR